MTSENEFTKLLDRKNAVAQSERIFSAQLATLRDITNYGTNLIPRSLHSSARNLGDIVIICVLLRQVVAMLDGIELLTSDGAVYVAALQMRTLFEASAYIEWILQGEVGKKATYFYVHNLRQQRLWAKRMQPGAVEAITFSAISPDLDSLRDPKAIKDAAKSAKNIDDLLSTADYVSANGHFDRLARNGRDKPWYVPLGIQNVRELLKAVGKEAEYIVFYSWFSGITHSSNFGQAVKLTEGRVTLEPIRQLKDFGTLFSFAVSLALESYRRILKEYRPDEVTAFNRKYVENWQKALMQIPKLTVTPNTDDGWR